MTEFAMFGGDRDPAGKIINHGEAFPQYSSPAELFEALAFASPISASEWKPGNGFETFYDLCLPSEEVIDSALPLEDFMIPELERIYGVRGGLSLRSYDTVRAHFVRREVTREPGLDTTVLEGVVDEFQILVMSGSMRVADAQFLQAIIDCPDDVRFADFWRSQQEG